MRRLFSIILSIVALNIATFPIAPTALAADIALEELTSIKQKNYRHFSAADASALEAYLTHNAGDIATRLALAHYYYHHLEHDSYLSHALTLINDYAPHLAFVLPAPDLASHYAPFKDAWLQQATLHPSHHAIMRNVALSLTQSDDDTNTVEALIIPYIEANPYNINAIITLVTFFQERHPTTAFALADAWIESTIPHIETITNGAVLLAFFDLILITQQLALDLSYYEESQHLGQYVIDNIARYEAIDPQFAFYQPLHIHLAYNGLGKAALGQNKIDAATAALLASANQLSTPLPRWFEPDITLASSLLNAGEEDAVIAYISACKAQWPVSNTQLEAWLDGIK